MIHMVAIYMRTLNYVEVWSCNNIETPIPQWLIEAMQREIDDGSKEGKGDE